MVTYILAIYISHNREKCLFLRIPTGTLLKNLNTQLIGYSNFYCILYFRTNHVLILNTSDMCVY